MASINTGNGVYFVAVKFLRTDDKNKDSNVTISGVCVCVLVLYLFHTCTYMYVYIIYMTLCNLHFVPWTLHHLLPVVEMRLKNSFGYLSAVDYPALVVRHGA